MASDSMDSKQHLTSSRVPVELVLEEIEHFLSESSAPGGQSETYRKSQPDVNAGIYKSTQDVDRSFELGCVITHEAAVAVDGLRACMGWRWKAPTLSETQPQGGHLRTSTDATKMASPSIACCR